MRFRLISLYMGSPLSGYYAIIYDPVSEIPQTCWWWTMSTLFAFHQGNCISHILRHDFWSQFRIWTCWGITGSSKSKDNLVAVREQFLTGISFWSRPWRLRSIGRKKEIIHMCHMMWVKENESRNSSSFFNSHNESIVLSTVFLTFIGSLRYSLSAAFENSSQDVMNVIISSKMFW